MNNAKCHMHVIMRTDLSDPEHARREYKMILNAQTNCLFRRERNGTIAYRITYLVGITYSYHLFSRSIFWNGMVLFEVFPSERSPSAFHFSEVYGTKWNDFVPV